MSMLSVFISAILLFLSILINKKGPLHPTVLFFIIWMAVCSASAFQITMYQASSESYKLIIIMLVCFFVGSLSYLMPSFSSARAPENEKISDNFNLYLGPIYFLLIVYILFSTIDSLIIVKNYLGGTQLWEMRSWRMSTYGVDSNPLIDRQSFLEVVLRAVVLYPFQNLVAPLAAFMFFNKKMRNKHKMFFVLAVICLLITVVATGGSRNTIVYYFGCFILCFILYAGKTGHEVKKKQSKFGRFLGLIVIVGAGSWLVLAVTNARTNISFGTTISSYLGVSPTLLSLQLPQIQQSAHTFGLMSVFGLITYPVRFLQQIGLGAIVPSAYDLAYQQVLNAQQFLVVNSSGLNRNAYVTPIYYFMIDGGIFFVIIGSLIFGFILGRFSKRFFSNMTLKNFIYYAVIMQAIVFSFVQVPTVQPSFVFSLILTWILVRPRQVDRRVDKDVMIK